MRSWRTVVKIFTVVALTVGACGRALPPEGADASSDAGPCGALPCCLVRVDDLAGEVDGGACSALYGHCALGCCAGLACDEATDTCQEGQ